MPSVGEEKWPQRGEMIYVKCGGGKVAATRGMDIWQV